MKLHGMTDRCSLGSLLEKEQEEKAEQALNHSNAINGMHHRGKHLHCAQRALSFASSFVKFQGSFRLPGTRSPKG